MELSNIYDNFVSKKPKSADIAIGNERILIIDGLNTFIRSFLAVPTMNYKNNHVGGLVGFIRSITNAIKNFNPTRCIIVFDGQDCAYRRRQLYPQYKSQRKNQMRTNRFVSIDPTLGEDVSFKDQLIRLEQYLNAMPVTYFMMNYIEADDIIGYMCTSIFSESEITIYSTDKDFLQLLTDNIRVYSPTKKKIYTCNSMLNEFGFISSNYLVYRALTGDVSDNIPGIRGMGIKTMLQRFPELISTPMNCTDIIKKCESEVESKSKYKIYGDIVNSKSQLLMNEELMQLHDVDMTGVQKMDIRKWCELPLNRFNRIEFNNLYNIDGLNAYHDSFIYGIMRAFDQLDYYAGVTA